MALKTYNPTTPGRRQLTLVDRSASLEGQAGEGADRGSDEDRRAQQPRPADGAPARRRPQARLPHRRFQAAEVRHAGDGRAARIRSEPLRLHRARSATTDGELAYILAPQRLADGDTIVSGEQVDVKPGNAMPLRAMPVGTIVHNVELKIGQRRPDRARRRLLRADRRPRPGLRDPAAEFRRAAPGAAAPAWRRSARSPTRTTPTSRSARPAATAGSAGGRRVRGVAMNPVDHPHGGGEGRTSRRPASGHARGASRPRARRPAATSRRRNTSCARGTPARAR